MPTDRTRPPTLKTPPESAVLYHACRSGDTNVQQAAYETLWGYLLPVVFFLVREQPDADDLAQDCAQQALVRIHQRLAECHEPVAFRTWARRIACNLTIDELRRRKRLTPLPDAEQEPSSAVALVQTQAAPDEEVLRSFGQMELRELLNQAPLSERSRRTIIGRYLDELADEAMAQTESDLAGTAVLPSHIQVTRAKNMAKLRTWQPLQTFLHEHV
ncbi:MAG: hypothetical protein DCC55_34710 [Chloroflexi bacterium]|nr:MAG: hypothetical protein DCC55_34710 [Chloroflexota bacterium]